MTLDPAPLARRASQLGETVFSEITALAVEHDAVNLGQGFPDFAPPDFVLRAAREALAPEHHQYARSAGLPELVETLAAELGPSFDRTLDPLADITVTVGATEGLFATIQALVDPGDEVILIEPFYDAYPADVVLCGGVPVYVPLRPRPDGTWTLDPDELDAAFSARTKLIVVNTPHNPTGKVFRRAELEQIAALCQHHDALALCDEVYEHILFDGLQHVRLATLPGMWERTVTLSSAGKTFSVTGWKIGWAVAPPALGQGIRKMHQWIPFAVATPLQAAVARILREARERGYFAELAGQYQARRDLLVDTLQEAGLRPLSPEGTYFVMADVSSFELADDVAFCRHLATEVGVAAIPPSAFYAPAHRELARNLTRFCFCKTEETLRAARDRLLAARAVCPATVPAR